MRHGRSGPTPQASTVTLAKQGKEGPRAVSLCEKQNRALKGGNRRESRQAGGLSRNLVPAWSSHPRARRANPRARPNLGEHFCGRNEMRVVL
jgi:hypothetical protein